jgi:hypothetical protein
VADEIRSAARNLAAVGIQIPQDARLIPMYCSRRFVRVQQLQDGAASRRRLSVSKTLVFIISMQS